MSKVTSGPGFVPCHRPQLFLELFSFWGVETPCATGRYTRVVRVRFGCRAWLEYVPALSLCMNDALPGAPVRIRFCCALN